MQSGWPEETELPRHLVALPGGQWSLWRWLALRGAGFPAAMVLRLAAPPCAAAADGVVEAEAAARRARDAALAALNQALDTLRGNQTWDDLDQRQPLLRALRRLKDGKLADGAGCGAGVAEALDLLRAAHARRDAAQAEFERAFADAQAHISEVIHEVARDERFQEAVIWQNRQVFHTALAVLMRRRPGTARGTQQRQHEELVANYLQRYCVKNDTIGFFGPVGWGQFASDGPPLVARPGPTLLAERSVYFESWCTDALARKLAESKAIRPWLAPRRFPTVHVEGSTLFTPFAPPEQLPADQLAVLQACDGTRMAREIAADLIRSPGSRMKSEQEVYDLLRSLSERGIISWTFELPLELRPERTLRRLLDRVGDERLRGAGMNALGELDRARNAVAAAAGAPAQLDQALSNLEATFTSLTGAAATRAAGKTYAARTLVYEDSRRDIEVQAGPELLEALGPPLSLVLTSARWFTYQVALAYRQAFAALYEELAREAGTRSVPLVHFWMRAQTLLFGEQIYSVDTLVPMLQQRWGDVLAVPAGRRQVAYSSAELRPHVQAAFDVPGPGWASARYHSPDVMIVATGLDAIERSDYQLVLGEMHLALNTISGSIFMSQHPSPEDLFLALQLDQPGPRLVPVVSRNWHRITSRTRPALLSPTDYRLLLTNDSGGIPKSRALTLGSLVVEDTADGMVVRTRDGRLRFDIIETFSMILGVQALNSFRILPPDRHAPRISIDRLVVAREAWNFHPSELAFANEPTEAGRFLAARRWMREHEMPRWVFVKLPVEVKPFYVDFESPTYINIFARLVRRTLESGGADARVGITEMLPGAEQTWLPDAEGRRYTSEMRIVALDQMTG